MSFTRLTAHLPWWEAWEMILSIFHLWIMIPEIR